MTTATGADNGKRAREPVMELDERPPTPNPSPQLSPTNHPLGDSIYKDSITSKDGKHDSHPCKRQKTAEKEHETLPPLTPPHSEQAPSEQDVTSGPPSPVSPRIGMNFTPSIPSSSLASTSSMSSSLPNVRKASSRPRVGFNSLPLILRARILQETLMMSVPESHFTLTHLKGTDPRILNPWLLAHFKRREIISLWCQVDTTWQSILRPWLFQPLVATNMVELNIIAGNKYQEGKGKGPYRKPKSCNTINGEEWSSETRADPGWEKKTRISYSRATPVREVILWMARLPTDSSTPGPTEEQRWPKWYVQDYMRYDLESLGCSTVRVLASNGAMLANALLATVPNAERIKALHLEIHHSTGALPPSDDRFFNVYRKNSAMDHLCPRLSMHQRYLETLTLRNVCACEHLSLTQFRRLVALHIHFVNANPGLCNATDPNVWADPFWWSRGIHEEVYRFRHMLIDWATYSPIQTRVYVWSVFDHLQHFPEGWFWQKIFGQLVVKQPGRPLYVCDDSFWESLKGGVKTLEELCRPYPEEAEEDEDEELSDEEELHESDYATDVENEDDYEMWEKRRQTVLHHMDSVRHIQPRTTPPQQQQQQRSPAPPPRPLRILG
ncbi:hypothetical protein EDC01DRAFT_629022 [Geopyxis carbonaria]|nr:hypothetical protein EDC01DRAFT_629022 [Geopyxis carbonaria]